MLVGNNVILRTVKKSDIEQIYELSADTRQLGDFYPLRMPSIHNFEKKFQEDGLWTDDQGFLLICDHQDRILGQVNHFKSFHYMDGLEIGYRIYQLSDHRKGYMSEAVALFVPYLFASRKISRIQACALADNLGSCGVLIKNGFTHEGTLRNAVFHNGVVRDIEIYSILREESRSIKEFLKPLA